MKFLFWKIKKKTLVRAMITGFAVLMTVSLLLSVVMQTLSALL